MADVGAAAVKRPGERAEARGVPPKVLRAARRTAFSWIIAGLGAAALAAAPAGAFRLDRAPAPAAGNSAGRLAGTLPPAVAAYHLAAR
jgi:hypothetical protein